MKIRKTKIFKIISIVIVFVILLINFTSMVTATDEEYGKQIETTEEKLFSISSTLFEVGDSYRLAAGAIDIDWGIRLTVGADFPVKFKIRAPFEAEKNNDFNFNIIAEENGDGSIWARLYAHFSISITFDGNPHPFTWIYDERFDLITFTSPFGNPTTEGRSTRIDLFEYPWYDYWPGPYSFRVNMVFISELDIDGDCNGTVSTSGDAVESGLKITHDWFDNTEYFGNIFISKNAQYGSNVEINVEDLTFKINRIKARLKTIEFQFSDDFFGDLGSFQIDTSFIGTRGTRDGDDSETLFGTALNTSEHWSFSNMNINVRIGTIWDIFFESWIFYVMIIATVAIPTNSLVFRKILIK